MELDHPYTDERSWLKGNLHTHTTESDGSQSVEDVIDTYAQRGYDFLAISDHDRFVDPADYRDETGLTLLPAVEVSADGPHLQQVGLNEAPHPDEDRSAVVETILDAGGIAILNHPKYQPHLEHWSAADIRELPTVHGIELYNGVIERHLGAATVADRWDQLLSEGHRLWGYANDDAHLATDVGRGWNVVQSEDHSPAAILDALAEGRFYASTGVSISVIDVEGGRIAVETTNATRIRLRSDHGVLQQTVDGTAATFRVPEQLAHRSGHTYVRIECLGRGGELAWTQPMYIND